MSVTLVIFLAGYKLDLSLNVEIHQSERGGEVHFRKSRKMRNKMWVESGAGRVKEDVNKTWTDSAAGRVKGYKKILELKLKPKSESRNQKRVEKVKDILMC
jgi:hypothetical protein